MREVEKYIPKLYKSLMDIYQNVDTEKETDVVREEYAIIDGISIDFGIMQRTRKAFVIRCDFIWDDIGSFASLSRFLGNCRGNSISGETYMRQSEGYAMFKLFFSIIAKIYIKRNNERH